MLVIKVLSWQTLTYFKSKQFVDDDVMTFNQSGIIISFAKLFFKLEFTE